MGEGGSRRGSMGEGGSRRGSMGEGGSKRGSMGEGGSRSVRTTRYDADIKVNWSRRKRPGKDRCGQRRAYKESTCWLFMFILHEYII